MPVLKHPGYFECVERCRNYNKSLTTKQCQALILQQKKYSLLALVGSPDYQ